MMINRKIGDERAEWSGVENKQKRIENGTLRNTLKKEGWADEIASTLTMKLREDR